MTTVFKLIGTENGQPEINGPFLFLLQQGALLGLKDAKLLNEVQYRQAEQMLLHRYTQDVRPSKDQPNG